VLAPQAASAALLAARGTATACLEAGPLSDTEANSTEEALATALPAGLWMRDKREAATARQLWLKVASATQDQQAVLKALPAGFKPCPVKP
jgi:hypothetical protein